MDAAPCTAFNPIYIHDGDVLTDATAKEILALDKTGANLCHWKQHHSLATKPAQSKAVQSLNAT